MLVERKESGKNPSENCILVKRVKSQVITIFSIPLPFVAWYQWGAQDYNSNDETLSF